MLVTKLLSLCSKPILLCSVSYVDHVREQTVSLLCKPVFLCQEEPWGGLRQEQGKGVYSFLFACLSDRLAVAKHFTLDPLPRVLPTGTKLGLSHPQYKQQAVEPLF